jgi:hypothetical protein
MGDVWFVICCVVAGVAAPVLMTLWMVRASGLIRWMRFGVAGAARSSALLASAFPDWRAPAGEIKVQLAAQRDADCKRY